nr:DUF2332 family protein [Exiguobacterium mexicanum]
MYRRRSALTAHDLSQKFLRFSDSIPEESTLCIFYTHVANQMTIDMKMHLLNVVEQIGQTREVFHLYNHIQDKDLHLDEYVNGVRREQTIAETDGHGRWFKWLLKHEALLP